MNLPNKLTIARIILTPFFLIALLVEFPHHDLIALLLFIIASLTDLIDGKLARSRNLITNFGKFLDPLADKMLTTAALLGFIVRGIGAGVVWVVFIVLFREFLVTSLRLVAVENGRVIAANIWGKAKTVSQMIAIIWAIAARYFIFLFDWLGHALPLVFVQVLEGITTLSLWVSAVLTVVSGVIYLLDNRKFIDSSK